MASNQTPEQQELNRKALDATYHGLVNIRCLANDLLREVGCVSSATVKGKLQAIKSIADALHNVPLLVADNAEYDLDLMKNQIEVSRHYWQEGRQCLTT